MTASEIDIRNAPNPSKWKDEILNAGVTSGLTYSKLMQIKQNFIDGEVGIGDYHPLVLFIQPEQYFLTTYLLDFETRSLPRFVGYKKIKDGMHHEMFLLHSEHCKTIYKGFKQYVKTQSGPHWKWDIHKTATSREREMAKYRKLYKQFDHAQYAANEYWNWDMTEEEVWEEFLAWKKKLAGF